MKKPQLTVDHLLESGFEEVGCWELNDARDLSHSIDVPKKAGVYAFAINGLVQYVGLASKSLKQRLGFYRKPGASQRTNVRLNEIIRGHIAEGSIVQILTGHPPDHEWNGFRISGPEGLEAGIIAEFDLPWNMRGSAGPNASEKISTETTGDAVVRYFVYENWRRDKAIVHREDCTFCDGGRGLHGTGATKNSRWHGPFDSAPSALRKAEACQRTRTEGCAVCSPL